MNVDKRHIRVLQRSSPGEAAFIEHWSTIKRYPVIPLSRYPGTSETIITIIIITPDLPSQGSEITGSKYLVIRAHGDWDNGVTGYTSPSVPSPGMGKGDS
jgi:hypothetical protein